MTLSELLRGVTVSELARLPHAASEVTIAEVRDDSREVQPGDLFVAVSGQTVDGHRFVDDAVRRGAVAVVVDRPVPVPKSVALVRVDSTIPVLAQIAANRYRRPAEALTLIAVTGTNGKTTTTHLVEGLLKAAGEVPGLLGTIVYRCQGHQLAAPFTTPTALLFHKTLAELRSFGATAVALEASSHALDLGRLSGVWMRVAAFTNLTQDHLDFHGDMERYFVAKSKLFHEHLLPAHLGGRAVINVDDPYGRRLAAALPPAQVITVSLDGPADVCPLSERVAVDGIHTVLRTPAGQVRISSPLTGRFNLANLAVAAGIGAALGIDAPLIGRGLSATAGVPGRLERVTPPMMPTSGGPGRAALAPASGGPAPAPAVFVDYAHTPDALARALSALRPLLMGTSGSRGRLIVVFGCGGDRDPTKRIPMGLAAQNGADIVVVTSDNPRTEAPQAIIDQIVSGVVSRSSSRPSLLRLERGSLSSAPSGYFVEADRRLAIQAAITAARPEDVVLLAGKGHEDYQIVGQTKLPFDDREEAHRALSQRLEHTPRSSPNLVGPTPAVAATIELPLERVLSSTGGKLLRGTTSKFTAVTIDSRAVVPGALFVAVRGARHDGHQFIEQAISAGAAGVLVQAERAPRLPESISAAVIEVADTLVALGQLSRAHREAPEIAGRLRVVAVTGSMGKTTTKDLVAAILSASVSDPSEVLKTEGNLNNHFGVPLTLLRLRPGHRYVVVEMGMSARGEIAYLASLARPDVGVITAIGPAHIETLGSLSNIAAAKGELFTGLPDGATAVYPVGHEHQLLHEQAVFAGTEGGRLRAATVELRAKNSDPMPGVMVSAHLVSMGEDGLVMDFRFPSLSADAPGGNAVTVELPLLGAHNTTNAALAAAAALSLDIPPSVIVTGLGRALAGKHRGQHVVVAGRHVLDDCYNANPISTVAAIKTLAGLRASNKAVAVLGDMLELGKEEAAHHASVGEQAALVGLSQLITLGDRAQHISDAATRAGLSCLHVKDAAEAAAAVARSTQPGDWVLLKGSRGMALERVLDHLRALLEGSSAPASTEH